MKRYNIHLPSEWSSKLDELTNKINKALGKKHMGGYLKRADTIRVGIAIAYNLELEYSYYLGNEAIKIIKNTLKKKSTG